MRIGFMGGTFSPPHKGHLQSAISFIDEAKLDRLIIIPAKVSPFKVNSQVTACDFDRMEMTKLCFLPIDSEKCHVEVSDIEMAKNETSYTIDTILKLEELYHGCTLIMYVGSDMFFSLEKWRSSELIFKKCIIYTRCRYENEMENMLLFKEKYEKLYGADIIVSDDKEIVVSSTDVRQALATKNTESCQNLLTEDVLGYIIKGGLYFD